MDPSESGAGTGCVVSASPLGCSRCLGTLDRGALHADFFLRRDQRPQGAPATPQGCGPVIAATANQPYLGIKRGAVAVIGPVGDGAVVENHHAGNA